MLVGQTLLDTLFCVCCIFLQQELNYLHKVLLCLFLVTNGKFKSHGFVWESCLLNWRVRENCVAMVLSLDPLCTYSHQMCFFFLFFLFLLCSSVSCGTFKFDVASPFVPWLQNFVFGPRPQCFVTCMDLCIQKTYNTIFITIFFPWLMLLLLVLPHQVFHRWSSPLFHITPEKWEIQRDSKRFFFSSRLAFTLFSHFSYWFFFY